MLPTTLSKIDFAALYQIMKIYEIKGLRVLLLMIVINFACTVNLLAIRWVLKYVYDESYIVLTRFAQANLIVLHTIIVCHYANKVVVIVNKFTDKLMKQRRRRPRG